MSRLRVFADSNPRATEIETTDAATIARELSKIGVTFARWRATTPITPGAAQDDVLAAYRTEVDRLVAQHGFKSVDVVSIAPDHPQRVEMRKKFLDEHLHEEDEVRFFVAGSGLFTLHVDARVYAIECVEGDLLAVPAGTKHWFDMGAEPSFVAIRFFKEPDGWIGHFTGSDIASQFPRYEP
jgi:1,2-dihydroxy-3-keto-5-methylthiopentene dioxygenase